jgi:hypothetical protein
MAFSICSWSKCNTEFTKSLRTHKESSEYSPRNASSLTTPIRLSASTLQKQQPIFKFSSQIVKPVQCTCNCGSIAIKIVELNIAGSLQWMEHPYSVCSKEQSWKVCPSTSLRLLADASLQTK